jgi:hypothetical protein
MRRLAQAALGILLLLAGSAGPGAVAPAGSPLSRAYAFLDREMDRYGSGASLRLVQSYVSTATFSNGDLSYTYDDDVLLIALLARGTPDDVARARVLGDSLVYVQAHDPLADGRVRAAYHARRLTKPDGSLDIASVASDTGNLAWTGLALAQLYRATGEQRYLAAAARIASFMRTNTFDARGAGGYTGGFTASGSRIRYKSTEHNIDLYALFTMLAQLTANRAWSEHAQHALGFVRAIWNAKASFFYIGTGNDGVAVNTGDPTPEDVQTWSFLATGLAKYEGSIDWALESLSVTGHFQGLSFEIKDRSGVWFEGTAHAVAALKTRNLSGDTRKAAQLIADVETAQAQAPNADGHGIDAASKDGLKTGDAANDRYYASLHIGATAWYCLAKQSKNPFRLLPRH